MDLQDNFIDDLTKPEVFLSKINNIKEIFPSILDNFKKYYVIFHNKSNNNEFQQIFENITGNLQNINSELSQVTNDIEKNTKKINDKLQKINDLIINEKLENQRLKKTLGIIDKNSNGSVELISDYKEIYNLNYLTNFSLFCGIILLVIIISLKFKVRPPISKV